MYSIEICQRKFQNVSIKWKLSSVKRDIISLLYNYKLYNGKLNASSVII